MSKKHKRGGVKGAFGSFMKTLLLLIVIPMAMYHYVIPYAYGIIIDVMAGTIEGLPAAAAADDIPMMDQVKPYLDRLVMCAVPLVIIAIPMGYFPRGDKRKVPCRVAFGIFSAVLVWITANGGKLVLTLKDIDILEDMPEGLNISSIDFALDITILIYVAMALCILKGLIGFLEYRAFRSELNEES